MTQFRTVKVFTDRYPLLGPLIWVATIEYFLIQLVVAADWKFAYSWRYNTISDLGNTVCGAYNTRLICSPLHGLMNSAFILLGSLMAIGSLLIYQEFKESRGSLVGFTMMAIAGIGTIIVGLFPENTVSWLHFFGAVLPFGIGNLSLLVLARYLYKVGRPMKIYTALTGIVALIALGFFLSSHYGPLGIGGVERLVAYPQTVWLIVFGSYMTRSHVLQLRAKRLARS